jgi:hypothetical protein
VIQAGTPAVLSVTPTTVVLTKATENNTAMTFTFTPANFGYKAAITYTLQFARPGNNFVTIGTIALPNNNTTQAVTVKALNIAALNAGLDTLSSQALQVRLKADVGAGQTPVYSNVLGLTVKPYSLNAFLYVPGDYQGWDPASGAIIRSPNKDKIFEGYAYIGGSSGEFKFTDAPNWNNGIFGDAGSGNSGNVASPGNNFKVTPGAFYKINANLKTNTWAATSTSWGLIGDAVPTTGWNSDQNMTYDAASKTWKITLDLNAAAIKFRANDDWAINFGDDGANGTLEYNGANIAIGAAGNYTITLDLRGGNGKYTYTVKKN